MSASVIVLNRYFDYCREVDVEKAIRWLFKNKIQVVVEKDDVYRSVSVEIKIPVVVRLLEFGGYPIKKEHIPYGSDEVFKRDNHICQYYHYNEDGKKFKYICTENEMTIDHVIPRSKGGSTDFLNCITSCKNCNTIIKKDRTVKEAGLELIRKPFIPRNRKGDMAVVKFAYNPNKLSHKYYYEKWLKKKFTHVSNR